MRLIGAAVGAAILGAAIAVAPQAFASGADAVVADLESQGYIVNINWVNGYNTKPLSSCTVVQINNPDRSGAPMAVGDAVYVDVRCPNSLDDEGGDFGVGIVVG